MKNIIITLLVIVIGVLSSIVFDYYPFAKKHMTEQTTKQQPENNIAYWVAPMDPNYRRDKAGKSPMGMDLIPVYNNNNKTNNNAIKLNPAVINNLGVRTGTVKRGDFNRQIETVGYIDYDETKTSHVHLRAKGWIEKLYVNSIGQKVSKGDVLFDVYSPELVNAQSDYLNALNTGRKSIISGSKERLKALGISKDLISQIAKKRKINQFVKIYAPQDGIVSELNVAEGMYVTADTTIISLSDLSNVWLLVDVFERQASLVKEGLNAKMQLSYEPTRTWQGHITYVYPQVDPNTRALKARLEFENTDMFLKPDMYANVTILGETKPNALTIPREALIKTGKSERVILALGNGEFQPAKVLSGAESGDRVEILEGLTEGEKIVTSAQFLIDSEANFKGSLLRMKSGD